MKIDEFENNCKETYPDAPELLKENEDPRKSSILDLLMKFHDRKFTSDLTDERYFFPFYINRVPYMDSNITSKTFCASISSEILHISWKTTDLIIMVARANLLLVWMKKERYCTNIIASFKKIFSEHFKIFHNSRDMAGEFIKHFFL